VGANVKIVVDPIVTTIFKRKDITMSVFAPTKINRSSVHHSQYIRTENEDKSDEADIKPAEQVNPTQPEAK
jgi:hypothetical protein